MCAVGKGRAVLHSGWWYLYHTSPTSFSCLPRVRWLRAWLTCARGTTGGARENKMAIPRVESSNDNVISSTLEGVPVNVEMHAASLLSAVHHADGQLKRAWRESLRSANRNLYRLGGLLYCVFDSGECGTRLNDVPVFFYRNRKRDAARNGRGKPRIPALAARTPSLTHGGGFSY
eukprot:1106877-Pyramimonas_sp.AAC.1